VPDSANPTASLSMGHTAYAVITPTRDEEPHLPRAIESMCAQTVPPARWILVNDGSRDRSGAIIDAAAAQHPWITAVHRPDRGYRQAGTGVIAAFYEGFSRIAGEPWDFVAKFDGDLSFPPDYFERCLGEFAADPQLGIAGGTCCKLVNGEVVPEFEGEPAFHVRGPTKIYRRECFEAIGGLIKAPGWDTVDQIKANMLGWKTRTFTHIRLIHHRPTGGAYGSWNDWVKNGLANYVTGYDPVFMTCKCLRRALNRPHLAGVALWIGFVKGYLTRAPRVQDRAMLAYLRRQQWRALTFRSSLWS
jgi:biofilm PGA synthesis N-glycosyltransferase PgaC